MHYVVRRVYLLKMELSDEEFRHEVYSELKKCDMETTSLKGLKKLLEERLGCELDGVCSILLSDCLRSEISKFIYKRKDLLKEFFNQYISEFNPSEDLDGEENGDEVGDEEKDEGDDDGKKIVLQ